MQEIYDNVETENFIYVHFLNAVNRIRLTICNPFVPFDRDLLLFKWIAQWV